MRRAFCLDIGFRHMPSVLCRRYPVHNIVVGKPPHTIYKLFLLFNHTIIIVDHFMYQAYTFFIKYLDFKFCSVISNIGTWLWLAAAALVGPSPIRLAAGIWI